MVPVGRTSSTAAAAAASVKARWRAAPPPDGARRDPAAVRARAHQHATAAKRGQGQLADQDARKQAAGSGLQLLASDSPNPEEKLLLAEEAEALLDKLPSEELRSVAIMRLSGHTNDEIADALGYTRRTIQRMLSVIRGHWEETD